MEAQRVSDVAKGVLIAFFIVFVTAFFCVMTARQNRIYEAEQRLNALTSQGK